MTFRFKRVGHSFFQNVNNPGKGDCGFYSFAIGLAHIIQQELAKGNKQPKQLDLLNRLSGKSYKASDFKKFHVCSKNEFDSEILENLMSDLRYILFQYYRKQIAENSLVIEGLNTLDRSFIFNNFLEIFNYYHHDIEFKEKYNLLFMSDEVKELAYSLACDYKGYDESPLLTQLVQQHFMEDLYGKDYLKKTVIPWDQTIIDSENLTINDRKLIAEFKQFNLFATDYFNNSISTRLADPHFKLKNEAKICAQNLYGLHKNIIIINKGKEINQNKLSEGSLYFEIDNETIKVYSRYLKKEGVYLDGSKSETLFSYFRKYINPFPFDQKKQLVLTSDSTLFNHFIGLGTSFLKLPYIKHYFLKLKSQEKNQEIKALLDLECTQPLSNEVKVVLYQEKTKLTEFSDNSRILTGLGLLKGNRKWEATSKDLSELAELFEVHLQAPFNSVNSKKFIRGPNQFRRPLLSVHNIDKYHWTTPVQIGYSPGNDFEKYAGWCYEDPILSKKEIKNILLSYTTGFVALFGREHKIKAEKLIRHCDQPNYKTKHIMQELRDYMSKQEYNPKCSFLKRFEYLYARYRCIEDDYFNKRDIERFFANYAETGYWRNHRAAANQIVSICRDKKKNIDDAINFMENYVRTKGEKQFNYNSSFMQCVREVRELKQFKESQPRPCVI